MVDLEKDLMIERLNQLYNELTDEERRTVNRHRIKSIINDTIIGMEAEIIEYYLTDLNYIINRRK